MVASQGLELTYHSGTTSWLQRRRGYSMGYDGVLKYARWAIEHVDAAVLEPAVPRDNEFRPDPYIPDRFRATLDDYLNSGYARGHLVPSADRRNDVTWQSETFFLSNMCPQLQDMNNGEWKTLEAAVRVLAKDMRNVWCMSLPLFKPDQPIEVIGERNIPVPHACGKAVLAESDTGRLRCWGLAVDNTSTCTIENVGVGFLEKWAGVPLYDKIPLENRQPMEAKKLWF